MSKNQPPPPTYPSARNRTCAPINNHLLHPSKRIVLLILCASLLFLGILLVAYDVSLDPSSTAKAADFNLTLDLPQGVASDSMGSGNGVGGDGPGTVVIHGNETVGVGLRIYGRVQLASWALNGTGGLAGGGEGGLRGSGSGCESGEASSDHKPRDLLSGAAKKVGAVRWGVLGLGVATAMMG